MILPVVLFLVGICLILFAFSAAKSSKRPVQKIVEGDDPIHPEVKLGVAATACLGGTLSFIGFVMLLYRLFAPHVG